MKKRRFSKVMAMLLVLVMSLSTSLSALAATSSNEISKRESTNAALSKKAASEGMVLLENNNNALPLKGESIALFGPGAERPIKGGTGSGDVNQRYVISVTEGLKNAGYNITSQTFLDRWYAAYEVGAKAAGSGNIMSGSYTHPDELINEDELTEAAKDTDTAVYVLSRRSGEGADRTNVKGDYLLSDTETANLTAIGAKFAKVVVVLNVGGIIDTKFFSEIAGLDSMLLMSNAGMESGNALANVLSGKVTPSGKLTDTWAVNYSDYPSSETFSGNDGNSLQEYYTDGIYVGYRYFDSFGIAPKYEFGYGKSYTDFSIKVDSVTADKDNVTVTATVKNTGSIYSGKEVVQVYFSAPTGSLEKPYQELAAYGKTDRLAPGKQQTLTLTYQTTEMSSYDTSKAAYVMEKGDYTIRVGNSSRNTVAASVVTLDADKITEQLSTQLTADQELTEISKAGKTSYKSATEATDLAKATKIALAASSITTLNNASEYDNESVTTYTTDPTYSASTSLGYTENVEQVATKSLKLSDVVNKTATMKEFVAQMSLSELASLCGGIGMGAFFGSTQPIVGAQSDTVDGAAGETVSDFIESYGIPNIVLADGPAGIRINQSYLTYASLDANGNGVNPSTMYQYCTAWPIGTLLAQTWDIDLIQKVGKAVGGEMVEMGVTLWLAPGMNIHRNPLCGRNFEYFSEDPFLTGMTAISETLGVQSNPGVGVTLKHFATNNQENNRNAENNTVSERAVREIYLKGFEMAVKGAQPMAIMTSYNKLNGEWAMNEYDLCTDVTRGEWGYKGLIMTDWLCAGSDAVAMHAGNDIIMPGGNPANIIGGIEDVAPVFKTNGQVNIYTDRTYEAFGYVFDVAEWKEFTPSATGTETVVATLGDTYTATVSGTDILVNGEKITLNLGVGGAANTTVTTDVATVSADGKSITYKGNYANNNVICLGDVQKSAMNILNIITQSYQMAALTQNDGTKAASYIAQFTDLIVYDKVAKGGITTAAVEPTAAPTAVPTVAPTAVPTAAPTYNDGITVKETATLYVGGNSRKTITINPTLPVGAVKSSVAFKSNKTSVATVDTTGKVTAKKAGTAIITTTVKLTNGEIAKLNTVITVKKASVKLTGKKATVKKGKSYTFKAKAYGSSKKITWKTSNKKLATITSKGKFKAIKKGTVKITATSGSVKITYTVKVK